MNIAAVIIGRNEGERFLRCLASVKSQVDVIVYVDSGSADGSIEAAVAGGADVVTLETTRLFTAARARNAGLERVLDIAPSTMMVQFIDGDCELQPGWISKS
ncbi:MAG: glycosyltransferase, partial [Alphaproteobacteria bacterium]|nr:glycosyltransferase [Alphaproteobacteria bacterium]